MKLAIVGLGKIGLCYLACLSQKHKVYGVDINKEIIEQLNNKKTPFEEPNLQKLLFNRNIKNFTTKHIEAIPESDAAFIRVPTPSKPDGSFSSEYVKQAVLETCRCIPEEKKYYLLVITSTVMPGAMNEIQRLAEHASNRKTGEDLGVCYMPDMVALGNAINNILKPDFVLIGESDNKAGKTLLKILEPLISTKKYRIQNFSDAELSKILINNYLSMKISFTNLVSSLAEKTFKADAEKILETIGADSRINPQFLKPGLGYGGFCFPRDQKAIQHYAKTKKIKTPLPSAIDKTNELVVDRVYKIIQKQIKEHKAKKIAFLGVTYKPGVPYTRDSSAFKIFNRFKNEILLYDPMVTNTDAENIIKKSEIIFIGTPWEQFKNIDIKHFKNKTVIDSFGILKHFENKPEINYIRLGTCLQ